MTALGNTLAVGLDNGPLCSIVLLTNLTALFVVHASNYFDKSGFYLEDPNTDVQHTCSVERTGSEEVNFQILCRTMMTQAQKMGSSKGDIQVHLRHGRRTPQRWRYHLHQKRK